ncbi:S24 family peptidase [Streptococcus mitis]|uniref:S24 family peptidase n=1 Tax=Streptococcus mitis TaxID=28037 RepID=UPI0020010410|nr:S24 family peptidase [Streptococcus mitis]
MTDKELAIYIGTKIKEYRLQRGLTQKELAVLVDMGGTTIANYEKGFRTPKKNTLFKISSALSVTIDDLFPPIHKADTPTASPDLLTQQITDTVVQLTPDNKKIVLRTSEELLERQNEEETKINEVSEKVVQLYGYDYYDHAASAGTGQYLNDVRVERIELPVDIDADFVIPIKGDSMEPDYHDGDLVFIQTSVDLNDGVIGVFNYNGEAYIKQLVIDTEQAYLHSLNPDYKDMPITPETDFRIIGEVVNLYREK